MEIVVGPVSKKMETKNTMALKYFLELTFELECHLLGINSISNKLRKTLTRT